MRKKGKSPRQKLEQALWEECKRITRCRHGNTCYTCGAKNLAKSNWQTGHGKPKAALPIKFKYDIRFLRPQCWHCNLNLGGVSDIFITKLEKEEEGLQVLNESCRHTEEGWIIRRDESMGGMEATLFLEKLLETYKNTPC